MKNWGKRWLALTLSVALLIGCTVSGLVLPAVAETTEQTVSEFGENLIANGDFEGDEWSGDAYQNTQGYDGGKGFYVSGAASYTTLQNDLRLKQPMEAGKWYILRFKTKGDVGRLYANSNRDKFSFMDVAPNHNDGSTVSTNNNVIVAETDWVVNQRVFQATEIWAQQTTIAKAGLLVYRGEFTKSSVYYDDFELIEYVPGMNFMPAADGSMLPYAASGGQHFFYNLLSAGMTMEVEDGAWKVSGLGNGISKYPPLGTLAGVGLIPTDGSVTISFRYKGDGAKVTITSANVENAKVDYSRTVEGADGWKYYKVRFTLLKDTRISAAVNFNFSGADTVLIDDFYFGQSTQLELSDLTWTPEKTQLQTGTEMQFSATLSNTGALDVKESTEIAVDFVAKNGEDTIDLGSVVHQGGLKAGESVTLTLPTKWTALAGEWVISAHANTNDPVEKIGTQGQIRVADTALVAPNEALAGGFDTLVFSDDFDIANVDTEYTGDYGYKWYLTDLTGICGDKTDYSLDADGDTTYMTLAGDEKMNYNWLMATMDGFSGAGWHGFQYGYLEFRTRFDSVYEGFEGSTYQDLKNGPKAPAIWSFAPEVIANGVFGGAPSRHVEMDWMEYWGRDDNNCLWTITLHDQIYNTSGNPTTAMNNLNSSHIQAPKNDIGDGQWHTVGYRWEKGLLIAYLDGREIFYQDWSENGALPAAAIRDNIGELRDDAFTPLDNQLSPLILAANEAWPLEIDYIRVWQKNEQDPYESPLVDDETTMEALHWVPGTSAAIPLSVDKTLRWCTDNPAVASVGSDGVIATHHEGKALITAYRGDKAVWQYVVTVDRYGEMVPAGDFEQTANDEHKAWHNSNTPYKLIADGKGSIVTEADGNRALKMPKPDSEKDTSGCVAGFTLKPATTYRFSGRVKGPAGARIVYLNGVTLYDKSLGYKYIPDDKDNEWVEFSYTFTTSKVADGKYYYGSGTTLFLYGSSSGTYFDDLSLVQTDGFLVHGIGTRFEITSDTKNSIFYTCFEPTLNVAGYTVTLRSQNTSILANTSITKLTAKACGSADVTVTATPTAGGSALTATIKVSVVDGRELMLNHSAVHLLTDDTMTLQMSVLPAGSTMGMVTYASDNTAVATVDKNGKVTAVGAGIAKITATTSDALSATCDVVVENRPTVAIDEPAASVWVGETVTLNATATPGVAAITWKSSDTTVATVQNGVVKALKPGTATITATVNGGNFDTCKVTVADKPTISITQSIAVSTGETATLTATVTPDDTEITWESSDKTVATVQNGVVTAVGAGTATITATVNGGNSATCTVTVTDKPILESFGISMSGLGLHFPKGVKATKENVDGIRFGTRIDFGEGYKIINDVLHLPHNNEYYEVVSTGTILRRHEDGTELTLENKTWISEAYNSTDNRFTCVKFTDTYTVFAVNMMTREPNEAFNAREYDARGYIQLNIDGVVKTFYTDLLTDSVNKAFARAMAFDIIISEKGDNVYDNEE